VYQHSKENANVIASSGHEVVFGVDATALSTYFGGGGVDDDDDRPSIASSRRSSFDRVQFNFPHWKGKANNRYNR
jgi:hypothetical protein